MLEAGIRLGLLLLGLQAPPQDDGGDLAAGGLYTRACGENISVMLVYIRIHARIHIQPDYQVQDGVQEGRTGAEVYLVRDIQKILLMVCHFSPTGDRISSCQ